MSKRMFSVFGVLIAVMFLAFCGGPLIDKGDMPGGIWMTVPESLDDGGSGMSPMAAVTNNTNEGAAYEHIKSYVRAAKILISYGDQIAAALRANWTYMKDHKGTIVSVSFGGGGWAYMNDQGDGTGYYVYYGTNSAATNFYFDWEGTSGAYKGKLVLFLNGTNDTPIECAAYYDQTLADRLEIFAKYDGTGVWKITNLRVLLVELSPGEIKVQAMAEYDRPYPMAWQLQGYGKTYTDGGAIAYATGKSNVTVYYGTNYIYQEYFNSVGYTMWKMGNYDLYSNDNTLLISGATNASDTYTNGTKPAGIETILLGITRLANCDYPVLTLP